MNSPLFQHRLAATDDSLQMNKTGTGFRSNAFINGYFIKHISVCQGKNAAFL